MARSISPFFIHWLPRATYDFAESAREVCAAAPQDVSSSSVVVRRMRRVIRSRFVECSQTPASADIAFFIKPPSTTKATFPATTRHAAEFFTAEFFSAKRPTKKSGKSIDQIGGELHVDYILEGSVRREAGSVRISARLIRAHDQTQVWADNYERERRDILVLQSQVARAIARQIRVQRRAA